MYGFCVPALVAVLFRLTAWAEVVRFDPAAEGYTPAGWTVAMTHAGGPPKWELVRDSSRVVLAQLSRNPTAGRFPLAVWGHALLRDGEVSVAFKAVEGTIDRAAGIIWRY